MSSHRGAPQSPQQTRLPTSTAQEFANGRAEAGQSDHGSALFDSGLPGRCSRGRAHRQKTSNFLTGCLVRTHRDSFFPRAFFYSPHSPHFFRQILSGWLGREKRISIRKWRYTPMETYVSKDLLPKAYFTDQTSPKYRPDKPRNQHIRIYTHKYA